MEQPGAFEQPPSLPIAETISTSFDRLQNALFEKQSSTQIRDSLARHGQYLYAAPNTGTNASFEAFGDLSESTHSVNPERFKEVIEQSNLRIEKIASRIQELITAKKAKSSLFVGDVTALARFNRAFPDQ